MPFWLPHVSDLSHFLLLYLNEWLIFSCLQPNVSRYIYDTIPPIQKLTKSIYRILNHSQTVYIISLLFSYLTFPFSYFQMSVPAAFLILLWSSIAGSLPLAPAPPDVRFQSFIISNYYFYINCYILSFSSMPTFRKETFNRIWCRSLEKMSFKIYDITDFK